jgi:amino acid adenylation domain-containing protein/thioester reductase-like protein
VSTVADDVSRLSEQDKRALLAQLLGQDGDQGGERLLPAQRRYWVLHQISPQLPTHVVRVLEIDGELDHEALRGALAVLADGREELRARFLEVQGRPVRAVAEAGSAAPELRTFSVTGADDLLKVRCREAGRPFDLETPPLLRAAAIQVADRRHEVVLTAHQVICDEAAMDLIVGRLLDAYDAIRRGEVPPPEPGRLSYAKVVDRQRAWLRTPLARRQLAYWAKALAGIVPVDLPTDHARPAGRIPSLRGARRSRTLAAGTAQAVAELAARCEASKASVVLAAYAEVLGRYTRERDVAVGIPVPGRDHTQADIVAPLENTVVLRASLADEPSFEELVRRVQAAWAKGRDHQLIPFEHVVNKVQPDVDLGRAPLHQVRFVPHEAPRPRTAGGATWTVAQADVGLSAFDLTVHLVEEADGGLGLHADYSTELFKPQTVDLVLGHIEVLLAAAATDPAGPSHRLPMLSDQELGTVLHEWNRTEQPFPADRCLHELIADQVRRTPDALAVVAGPDRLTYRQLDEWASRLANRLRAAGVGPETLVGVVAARRVATVAAFLGVLKAGGGYVPLDPEQPAERTRAMIADAGIRTVVVTGPDAAVPPEPGETWIDVHEVTEESTTVEPVTVDPANVAYVIYTSGSTGRPKGVVVPHRQIVNSTLARTDGRPAPEAYAIPVSLTFDASAAGLYWTLVTGGRIVLPNEDEVRNPALLARLVQAEQVTHITHMPSYYQLLLAAGGRKLISLRDISAGGDVFPAQLAVDHYKTLPWAKLYNDYGPTEVTVWATAQLAGADEDGASVPIGRPIRNTRIYLLDEELNPVPIGVPGEIHVAGEGLARGYANAPGQTADRFVPDPFSPVPGGRLYRTGDLARYLPDGRLEFVGRADTQVKVRGFRIELSEIENALQRHPEVLSAVVDVRRSPAADENELIAYVIPAEPGAQPDTEHITAHLRTILPAYMLPAAIVVCERFPLNAHGKVERKALPDPEARAVAVPTEAVPRRRIEREIAEIFAEALGLPRVGLHDDFFSYGGSSLQLSKVGAKLAQVYGLELPLHALFSTPTVAGVASRIELYEREGFEGLRATRDPADDLDREAYLEESITGENLPLAEIFSPKAVLLTGGTGYFGVFLLEQLIAQTTADVYCLVRAKDQAGGLARLKASCEQYEVPWDDRFDRRVKAVNGDLSRPLLGLSPDEFEDLAKLVDVIYHNGALVNFSMPYSALKAPNVDGTVEILRLASRYKAKQVHFVSTIDVFIAGHMTRPFLEVELPSKPPQVPFSYPQSKWVSEKIILTAKRRGLPITIFRPSIMMGHPKTGACHAQNYVLTALRGFLEFGVLPDYAESMNAITLDYASAAMVHASRQESSVGNIFHLWNTDAISHNQLYPWIRSYGYPFEVVPFDEALELAINAGPDHPIYPMVPVLLLYSSGDAGVEMTMETEDAIDNRLECVNLLEAIKGTGWEPAPLNEKYMHDCLDFLVRHGQLDPPDRYPRKR